MEQTKKILILKKNIPAQQQPTINNDVLDKYQQLPPGLKYIENFITAEEEQILLDEINKMPWDNTLKRLTQHYGYKYPYKSKDKLEPTQDIPAFCMGIKDRLEKEFDRTFDQLIVNRYEPGQGIAAHTDHIKLFGDTIISLSLGSQCIMNFAHGGKIIDVFLARCSLAILQDDARYKWTHSIASRKSDNGIPRSIRISMTFRQKI
jgi:alkylated DNA repair dioxygenase AlkB